ncbi:hypothetical protein V5O48_012009 [Marasmius crinis-equi]|uniref:Peptidase A2 domain-containing protein n=1 Tax=Marasmius crinis-equi TaxID=585013 RepID=A0ABR3F4G6_9AGAR
MQVVAGMYRRFIHEASINKSADKWEEIHYTRSSGAEGLFEEMKKCALSMPTPPDMYRFRKRLFTLLPMSMIDDMSKYHGINPVKSTLQDIMVAATALEQGERAREYALEAKKRLDRDRRRCSRSRSRDRIKNSFKRNDSRDRRESRPPFRQNNEKGGKSGQFSNRFQPGIYRDRDDKGRERLYRIAEVENKDVEPSEVKDLPNDEQIWAQYEHESEPSSSDIESEGEHSPDPYGSSQYESDSDDRVGLMLDGYLSTTSDLEEYTLLEPPERLAVMNDSESSSESHYESCQSDVSDSDHEDGLRLDFKEYFRSIEVQPDGSRKASVEPRPMRSLGTLKRPVRTATEKRCLAAWIELNGLKAFALFDSGSTADVVSPDFVKIAKMRIYRLENPVTFQLGTKGSKSRITHGCTTSYSVSSAKDTVTNRDYFDIANVDRYDAVVGTVFMRRHGIALDFNDDTVKLRGSVVPTLTEGEELTELVCRSAKRASDNIVLEDNQEIEVKPRPKKKVLSTDKEKVVILPEFKQNSASEKPQSNTKQSQD